MANALGERTTEALEADVTEQAAHVDAFLCRWLQLVGEFDAREGYGRWECASMALFLNGRCGISLRTAHDHVRVARALRELPLITEAFAAGEISYSKVRAIARVATPENEAILVTYARHTTAAQLERIVAGCRRVQRQEAETIEDLRGLTWLYDDDSSFIADLHLTGDEGALLLAALRKVRDELQCSAERNSGECSAEHKGSPRVSYADALVAMAETALTTSTKAASGSQRHLVLVHYNAATGAAHLNDGPNLAEETGRRLLCDAAVLCVAQDGADVLNIGRSSRTPTAKQRAALLVRDGGCVFPGCHQRQYVDAHHVIHWLDGGETDLANLVLLCRRHHRAMHEGGYSIQLAEGIAVVRRPDGSVVERAPAPPSVAGPDVAGQNRDLGLAITPDTPVALWDGEPIDYGMAVEGLLAS